MYFWPGPGLMQKEAGGIEMEFWYGVVFTLLMETVALIFATERLIKEKQNVEKNSVSG